MPTTPIHTYAVQGLQPYYPNGFRRKAVRLVEGTYTRGQVIAEVQGTNEAQLLTLATAGTLSGTYTLSFGGQATTAIAFNATALTVQAALEALATIGTGNVLVTGTTPTSAGGTLTITFVNDLGYRDVAPLVLGTASLTGNSTSAITTTTAGAGYANEQQTLTRSGTVSGGTYRLTYSGQQTAAIAYDATAATVQTALAALSTIGFGNVGVTGTPTTALVVTFTGALAGTNVAALTVDNASITGGGTIVVTTPAGGAAAAGTHRAFDSTGTDGREKARAVLEFDTTVDSSGRHYWATTAASEFGPYQQTAPAWIEGYFLTGPGGVDLAEAHLTSCPAWHMVEGNVAQGVVKL